MIEEMRGDFFQWLRGFYYVATTKSVSLAAAEMGRNQPAISHQIKCLEKELGVTLFDRSKGSMELTPEGVTLFSITLSIFELVKEMKGTVGSSGHLDLSGEIIIATTHAVVLYFLPRLIADFKGRYPNVNFDIKGGGLNMILDAVESGQADFGIVSLEETPERFICHELFEARLVLIVPKNSWFSVEKEPTLALISKFPLILFPRASSITQRIEKRFSESGLKPNVVLILNNFEIVKKYVELGMGVSILDDYAIEKGDEQKLDIFPLDHLFEARRYILIFRKRKYLSPPVRAFIHSIKPDI
jgi:DNA-binding transcriptional LysR family regulator